MSFDSTMTYGILDKYVSSAKLPYIMEFKKKLTKEAEKEIKKE